MTTETAYRILANEVALRAILVPAAAVDTRVVEQQTTDPNDAPWVSSGRPPAGLRELRWSERNSQMLRPFEGQWIAIKGTHVVKHGASFEEVHDALSADGISQALILYVREEAPEIYDIA